MANFNKPHNYTPLVGQTFGLWTVLTDDRRRHGKVLCLARCVCGTERYVAAQSLKNGSSHCCGCATHGKPLEPHGHAKSAEYRNWVAMLQRCYNPNSSGYKYYGARGVTVCDPWRQSFATFLSDMGPRPKGRNTVDRINGTRGYEPDNCHWATQTEQTQNQSHPIPDISTRRRDAITGRFWPDI